MPEGPEQDDPEVVLREYADETGLSVRSSLWARRSGLQPQDVAFDELVAVAPRQVLDAGCGRGELAQRLRDAGVDVTALDQSERMVQLTRARAVDAVVGDVQALPFADAAFDAVVANFMLYHVPELGRALSEIVRVLRPGGRFVAATNGVRQLGELWDIVRRDLSDRWRLFMRETGAELLRPYFAEVQVTELDGVIELTAAEMRHYVEHSVAHKHAADAIPDFDGTRPVTTSSAVFVATTPA